MFKRYNDENTRRIESLLERLLLHFENVSDEEKPKKIEENIEKCLDSIRENNDNLQGWNFI